MIRRALFGLLGAWLAGPVAALSCLPPDVARTYKQVDADTAHWGAVVGRLDFDESRLPRPDPIMTNVSPPETDLTAQFIGHSLTRQGWTEPFQQNVTLRVLCFGPWCAAPASGQTVLAFVKNEDGRHVVIADPCGNTLFPVPSRADMRRVQDCFAGRSCKERPLN